MRYLVADYLYVTWLTLRKAYKRRSEGQTFRPVLPKDIVLSRLASAAGRPRQSFGGREAHSGLFRKVAALGHGIAAGHCFGNGNKRTAFLSMSLMFEANGWRLEMPPGVVAFVMLRTASNNRQMSLEDLAVCLAAYAFIPRGRYADEQRRNVEHAIRAGGLVDDRLDPFPIREPADSKQSYIERANAIVKRDMELFSQDELDELKASFTWPIRLMKTLTTWSNVIEHRKKSLGRRKAYKRIGKRRLPHKGGRTIKKICPPITDEALGLTSKPAASKARV